MDHLVSVCAHEGVLNTRGAEKNPLLQLQQRFTFLPVLILDLLRRHDGMITADSFGLRLWSASEILMCKTEGFFLKSVPFGDYLVHSMIIAMEIDTSRIVEPRVPMVFSVTAAEFFSRYVKEKESIFFNGVLLPRNSL